MKPGDTVSFNVIKNGQIVFGVQGVRALEHFDIVREEEMLDIIWKEDFYTTSESKELHLLKTLAIKLEEKL